MPQDMLQLKIYYENKFLEALVHPEGHESKIQAIVENYTDYRFKQCMLDKGFSQKLNSKYGFLYLKMIRERVHDELGITKETNI